MPKTSNGIYPIAASRRSQQEALCRYATRVFDITFMIVSCMHYFMALLSSVVAGR
ncbi:605_t:CDS:2 [Funneliformis mosseae]|uniref:605_t:CDS:1 n=1 Tax=Funneliformis mosseae TaxID=27381 RepID=A0A9N8Z9N9_FUNMO|nr:605_t:CDS:2 [Funneliformis mosseae]